MSWLTGVRARLRLLFGRRGAAARMEEEFRFQLEMETERRVRAGATPAEARRQALIAFGGAERHRELIVGPFARQAYVGSRRDALQQAGFPLLHDIGAALVRAMPKGGGEPDLHATPPLA